MQPKVARRLSALAYATSLSGSILYSKFIVSRAEIPFFVAFSYAVFASVAWVSAIVAMAFMGAKIRMLSPRAVPMLVHVSGFTQAIVLGLWVLSISRSDPVSFFSLVGLQYVFCMILPMFIRVQFRQPYNFGTWPSLGLGVWMIIGSVLTVTQNPLILPVWAVIIVLAVGMQTIDGFIKLKLLLEYKMSAECTTIYTTLESVVWLFGMAFVLDMGAVVGLPDFEIDVGWISLGMVIYFLHFVSSVYFLYKTLREDRTPYAYQVAWAILAVTSPFAFGISMNPINIAGVSLTLLGSAAIEFLETRSRPPLILSADEGEWVFTTDTLGPSNGTSH